AAARCKPMYARQFQPPSMAGASGSKGPVGWPLAARVCNRRIQQRHSSRERLAAGGRMGIRTRDAAATVAHIQAVVQDSLAAAVAIQTPRHHKKAHRDAANASDAG